MEARAGVGEAACSIAIGTTPEALMRSGHPHVVGFCYTQLTDVEQERNGLLDAELRPKFPIEVLRGIVRGSDAKRCRRAQSARRRSAR